MNHVFNSNNSIQCYNDNSNDNSLTVHVYIHFSSILLLERSVTALLHSFGFLFYFLHCSSDHYTLKHAEFCVAHNDNVLFMGFFSRFFVLFVFAKCEITYLSSQILTICVFVRCKLIYRFCLNNYIN